VGNVTTDVSPKQFDILGTINNEGGEVLQTIEMLTPEHWRLFYVPCCNHLIADALARPPGNMYETASAAAPGAVPPNRAAEKTTGQRAKDLRHVVSPLCAPVDGRRRRDLQGTVVRQALNGGVKEHLP
jgi:hypothetical protein